MAQRSADDYYIPTSKDKKDFRKAFAEARVIYRVQSKGVTHKVSELTFKALTQYVLIQKGLIDAPIKDKIDALIEAKFSPLHLTKILELNDVWQIEELKKPEPGNYYRRLWDRCYGTPILSVIADDIKTSKLKELLLPEYPLFTDRNREIVIKELYLTHSLTPILESLRVLEDHDKPMLPYFNRLTDEEKSSVRTLLLGLINQGVPKEGINQQFYYSNILTVNTLFADVYNEMHATVEVINAYFNTHYEPNGKRINLPKYKRAEEFVEQLKVKYKDGVALPELIVAIHNRPDDVLISYVTKVLNIKTLITHFSVIYRKIVEKRYRSSTVLANKLSLKLGIEVRPE